MELVERMLAGDQLALARLVSLVENRSPFVPDIMRAIYPRLGHAYCVGVTGPPGAGKSTLVDRLTQLLRRQDATVGIIAVDPTSPFSGGAVLGDRIRMQQHYLDKGVFIRSMATRGSMGGLARATKDAIKLFDAFGKDYILVETVGVGQTELDIVEVADTTLVVLVPESGDTIQTMKAGLMEIADLFVVNKADREGADNMVAELRMMVRLSQRNSGWEVPVLATQAHNNIGIPELYQQIERHRGVLYQTAQFDRRRGEYRRYELLEIIEEHIKGRFSTAMRPGGPLAEYAQKVEAGELDPYTAAQEIFAQPKLLLDLLG